MGLSQQDLLSTLAEVSAAFVGFSMIVSLFRSSAVSKSRVLSVRDVAETSLARSIGAVSAVLLALVIAIQNPVTIYVGNSRIRVWPT